MTASAIPADAKPAQPLRDERLANYGYRVTIQTRWADCDAYGHVNNVIYLSWFDTAVTRMLIERGALKMHDSPTIGLCVESHCEFFEPVEFPENVEAGVRIGKLGSKSIRYEVGLFREGSETPAAAGHFVHVFVDRTTRKPAPLTDAQKAALAELVR